MLMRFLTTDTVQFVSMPRSGHHLLVEALQAARPRFRYCEFYHPENCCHAMPCQRRMEAQKSHDFGLRDPVDPARRYVIQIRDPLPSIMSHYELRFRGGIHARDDSPEIWEAFATEQARHRLGFLAKWCDPPPPRSVVVRYEDLLADLAGEVARVGRFLWHDFVPGPVPEITPPRDVSAFRYPAPDWLAAL